MEDKFNQQFIIWKNGQIVEKKLCSGCNKKWIYKFSNYCKSCAQIGEKNHFYSKTHNNFSKLKMSKKKENYVPWNKGMLKKSFCKICGIEISRGSEYCRKCFGVQMMGDNNPSKRKEVKEKISKSNSGQNNGSWNGGSSFLEYPQDFTSKLTESIRLRDKHTCRECGKHQSELQRKLHVHHVDYNKKNCGTSNLISLCNSCHMRTNFNRKEWKNKYERRG